MLKKVFQTREVEDSLGLTQSITDWAGQAELGHTKSHVRSVQKIKFNFYKLKFEVHIKIHGPLTGRNSKLFTPWVYENGSLEVSIRTPGKGSDLEPWLL